MQEFIDGNEDVMMKVVCCSAVTYKLERVVWELGIRF